MHNTALMKIAAYANGFIKAAMDFGFTEGEAIDMFKLAAPEYSWFKDLYKEPIRIGTGALGGGLLGALLGSAYSGIVDDKKAKRDMLIGALLGVLGGGAAGGLGLFDSLLKLPGTKEGPPSYIDSLMEVLKNPEKYPELYKQLEQLPTNVMNQSITKSLPISKTNPAST